ncbi:Phage shock protein PspC (stress-responsive transcriptional regulator) [Daejeonella rubra]|uniref:Phage shock protein PspC (Stress-responsive transcriptional regulator) n=1 Tax=Daejeonella rubra TaxID=990371 RepID=A0A1G9YKW5_9SPHI|nr:PspC domain-containing protein [Daejeonella rubra]SDN09103.1 Phage shock protein PspC (stress-responsive transcriptional regulator) [Daejeonella rubra]
MEKKLQRNQQDKMIAGVCSGLADYFDVDVTWVRIAFVVAVMAGASGLLAYIVLWIAVPRKPYVPDYGQFTADYKVNDPGNPVNPFPYAAPKKKDNGSGRLIAGAIFIFFGTFFLLNEFNLIPDWVEFHNLWPLILIGMGIYTLSGAVNKDNNWKDDLTQTTTFSEPEVKPDAAKPDTIKTDASENVSTEETNPSTDDSTNKQI